jgi:hypothetical protein
MPLVELALSAPSIRSANGLSGFHIDFDLLGSFIDQNSIAVLVGKAAITAIVKVPLPKDKPIREGPSRGLCDLADFHLAGSFCSQERITPPSARQSV